MKVKFIGFGGYLETPCYQDENSKIYFDTNNGYRSALDLHDGAYMDEFGDIVGEPNKRITEKYECDNQYKISLRTSETLRP